MVFKNLYVFLLWTKVASALEGLRVKQNMSASGLDMKLFMFQDRGVVQHYKELP